MPRPRSHPARRPTAATALATATLLTSLPLTSPRARAADATWSSPTSGRWLDPTRWSTAAVPTSSDTATINALGSYTVTLNAPAATLSVTNVPSSFASVTTGALTHSAGTLALHSTGSGLQLTTSSLSNAATITLDADTAPSITNPVATISTNSANVTNSGTIVAHAPPAATPPNFNYLAAYAFTGAFGRTFTNTGTLRTTGGSSIYLNNYTLNNTGSLDGDVEIYSGALNYNGGSCSPSTPVYLQSSPLKIAPAATNGNFDLGNFSSLTSNVPAGNTVSTWNDAHVRWSGAGSTLTNAGHLTVGYLPFGPNSTTSVSPSLDLGSSSNTLLNTGTLELNSPRLPAASLAGSITNQGAVTVNAPNTSVNNNPTRLSGSFTQNAGGSLTIAPATSLSLTNSHFYFNAGSVTGTVALDNSTVHFAPSLAGSGTFTYTAVTSGTPAPPFAGDIPSGVTLVHTAGPNPTSSFSLPSFTNAGSLRISVGSSTNPPIYNLSSFTGTLTNTGTIGGTYNGADRGAYFNIYGSLVNTGTIKSYALGVTGIGSPSFPTSYFNQNAGTLDVDSYCFISHATFNYNGGTITGKPVDLSTSTLYIAPGTNPASFTFYSGPCTFHGAVSAGSTLALDSVSFNGSTVTVTADPLTNAGTLSLASSLVPVTSTLTVTGSGALTNSGTLSVTQGKGGTRTLNANVTNSGTLSVGPGATLTLNGSLSTSTPLDLQGTLDLKLSPLTWTSAPPTAPDTLRSLLSTAHLTSSSADSTHRLAYLLNPTNSTITVKTTINGDANLDGSLTPDDYALLDKGFSSGGTTWWAGDFNYDGTVDQNDYLLIDTTLAQTTHSLSPDFLAQRESQFGAQYVQSLLTCIPEPSSVACLFAGLLFVRRRNQRKTHPFHR